MPNNIIRSYQSALLTSNWLLLVKNHYYELKRKFWRSPHQITFYYSAFDPYSHITAQLLPELQANFAIELSIVVVGATNNIDNPQHLAHAISDCKMLSQHHQLNDFSQAKAPSPTAFNRANQRLLQQTLSLTSLIEIGQQLWCEPCKKVSTAIDDTMNTEGIDRLLGINTALLVAQGHYQSGMLYHAGHWYWSVDRLEFLARRLEQLGVCLKDNRLLSLEHGSTMSQEINKAPLTVELYISFRSPYSYIALMRLNEIAKQKELTIDIKLMLPMVMRGLAVSTAKKMYILHDAARIARRYNIPFGKVCDPLGDGIFDCINLYYYAKSIGRSNQFVTTIMQGIWSQGLDINNPKQLRKAVESLGINWPLAQHIMKKNDGVNQAHKNKEKLHQLGLWGVPSFHTQTQTLWGQDRLHFLHETSHKSL